MSVQSNELDKLATALSKAQSVLMNAAKSSDNPFFKSKYADLAECWDTIRKPLTDNGLSITQTMDVTESGVTCLVTTLLHSSGQWITGRLPLDAKKQGDPQATGSAITYARRYALAAVIGLAQADDDGNSASGHAGTKQPAETSKRRPAAMGDSDKIKSAMHKKLGIAQDDTATLDAVIQWATQGSYQTYAQALETDEDATAVVQFLSARHTETPDMGKWIELAMSRRRQREATTEQVEQLDREFTEVAGA